MADSRASHDSGNEPAGPSRRGGLNRTLVLSVIAMAVGFFLAGRVQNFWRDKSGVKRDFEVMRTYARITVPADPNLDLTPGELADLAERAVREVNDLMGPFGERSDVRRLNEAAAGEWVDVHPLTWMVVMESLRWHRLSGGAFDPTIGPIKRLFRFDQGQTDSWPDSEALAEAQSRVGADKLRFEREGMRLSWARDGMKLDLGAIAKGFAADRAAEVLVSHGVRNALVNIGGELRVLGRKQADPPVEWLAGVRNPRGGDVLFEMPLSNAAVATSGDYESFFIHNGKRYDHIIDPRTGLPLSEAVAGVTVVHPASCLAADALATTLCVLGREEGEKFIERQALGLFSKGVRVIMLTVDGDGKLRRRDMEVDAGGQFLATDVLIEAEN